MFFGKTSTKAEAPPDINAKNVVSCEILPTNSNNLAPASKLFSLGIGCPDSIQGHARVLSMCPALVIIKADLICSYIKALSFMPLAMCHQPR